MLSNTIKAVIALICSCTIVSGLFAADAGQSVAADSSKHFDPKGKPPSKYTIELQKGASSPAHQARAKKYRRAHRWARRLIDKMS